MRGRFDEKDKFVKKTRINSLSPSLGTETQTYPARSRKILKTMSNRTIKLITGALGLSGVALGAFGAHALKAQLVASGQTETWQTAVVYHLIHTVALLAITVRLDFPAPAQKPRSLSAAALCWIIGILFFSGSLYALALGGPRWLGPITPIGGLAFLIGWGCVLLNGAFPPETPKN
jgi:uncharacterized membrane protein YgdD (TMEM256/DUF423 family)